MTQILGQPCEFQVDEEGSTVELPFATEGGPAYVARLAADRGWRPPLVVVETAAGAVSLHGFAFPARCSIVVGSEDRGVDRALLQGLRPGYDSIVFVPMPGHHTSLNVATALGIVLFEYRRQWPEGQFDDAS